MIFNKFMNVITKQGIKSIDQLTKTDYLLNDIGKYYPIKNIAKEIYKGNIYNIKIRGHFELNVTNNYQFLVLKERINDQINYLSQWNIDKSNHIVKKYAGEYHCEFKPIDEIKECDWILMPLMLNENAFKKILSYINSAKIIDSSDSYDHVILTNLNDAYDFINIQQSALITTRCLSYKTNYYEFIIPKSIKTTIKNYPTIRSDLPILYNNNLYVQRLVSFIDINKYSDIRYNLSFDNPFLLDQLVCRTI